MATASGCPLTVHAQSDAARLKQHHFIYLARVSEPWSALTQLRATGLSGGPVVARLYAELGLLEHARLALAGWAGNDQADMAWLKLARAQYQAGQWQAAAESLTQTTRFLPAPLDRRKASLLARALLAQDRDDAAARALEALQQRDALTGIDSYNLGIAWLRSGDTSRGAGLLDALGSYRGDDALRQALADQANLVLGYWFLREQRGGLARAAFARIRLHGPLAANGKVGIGWAELAPAGGVQRLGSAASGSCSAPQPQLWGQSSQHSSFPSRGCSDYSPGFEDNVVAGATARDSQQTSLLRAAAAWESAVQAGGASRAVQEALVALPHALAMAGDAPRARAAYQQAIHRLEGIRDGYAGLSHDPSALPQEKAAFAPAQDRYPGITRLQMLYRLQHQLAALNTRIGKLQNTAAALAKTRHFTAAQALGSVLAALRKSANGGGQVFAHPDPAQRGLLKMALRPDFAPPAGSRARVNALLMRLRKLERQRAATLMQVDAAISDQAREIRADNLAFTTNRLREAYTGLANLQRLPASR